MSDSGAAGGVLLGGTALLLGLLVWPEDPFTGGVGTVVPFVLVVAVLTGVAFSAYRHGVVDRKPASILAASGAIGLTAGGLALFFTGELGSIPSTVGGVISLIGLASLGLAIAAYRETPVQRIATVVRVVMVGTAVGLGGLFLVAVVAALPDLLLEGVNLELPTLTQFALEQVAIGLGFVIATVVFFVGSGRGLGYFDLEVPGIRDLGYMIGGVVVVLVAAAVMAVVYAVLGVSPAEHVLQRRGREEGAAILLVAMAFAFLSHGLGEELLFRNGVQKYLTESMSATAAILISSVIFAVVHFPAYADPDPIRTMGAVVVVFALSLVLAVTYHRTQNVVVPIIIHGSYNAVVYLVIYLQLVT